MSKFFGGFRDCFRLQDRNFWRVLLILLAGKTLYLVLGSVSYEADTITYLNALIPFHHPPLYSMLLHLLRGIYASVYVIGGVQVLLFVLAGALFATRFIRTARRRYAFAVILALEPTTAFFCTNLMSEGLFVPLLMVWAGLIDGYLQENSKAGAIRLIPWIALVSALLYATRLVAVILVPFIPLLYLVRRRNLKIAAWHAIVLLVMFQALLVPFKLIYLQKHGSFSIMLFTGTPLWNSASVLYADSSVRTNPQTEFERFLAQRDLDEFTTDAALTTAALFDPDYAYDQFLRQRPRTTDERLELENSLVRTSMKIILGNPLGYVNRLVLPSYLGPLRADETVVISPQQTRVMQAQLGYRQKEDVSYRSLTWRIWLGVLVVVTVVQLALRRGGTGATVLLALSWYHTLVLPAISVVFIRYMLIVVPWVLMAVWLVAAGPNGGPAFRRAGDG